MTFQNDTRSHDDDEPILHWLFLVVGLVPVVTALVRGGTWGVEPSLGLLMAAFGALGLRAAHSTSPKP